jgi:hypothetical protein
MASEQCRFADLPPVGQSSEPPAPQQGPPIALQGFEQRTLSTGYAQTLQLEMVADNPWGRTLYAGWVPCWLACRCDHNPISVGRVVRPWSKTP